MKQTAAYVTLSYRLLEVCFHADDMQCKSLCVKTACHPACSMPGLDMMEEKQQAGERGPGLTAEQFAAWKQDKDRARQVALQEEMAKRQADLESGTVAMNGRRPSPSASSFNCCSRPDVHCVGRELFEHHPELFADY